MPGIKTDDGRWETRGHCSRLVPITEKELDLFARLFELCRHAGRTLRRGYRSSFASDRRGASPLRRGAARLADLGDEWAAGVMFDETYGQRDGIITRETDPTYSARVAPRPLGVPGRTSTTLVTRSRRVRGRPTASATILTTSISPAFPRTSSHGLSTGPVTAGIRSALPGKPFPNGPKALLPVR